MHGFCKIDGVQCFDNIAAVNEHLTAFDDQGPFRIGDYVRRMHLHERRLNEESGFARAGAADNNDIFIPGIFWNFGTAFHCQPFRLRQGDVLKKIRMDEWLDVIGISPSGRTVFHSWPILLCVLPAVQDDQEEADRKTRPEQHIIRMQAGERILKRRIKVRHAVYELVQWLITGTGTIEPCHPVAEPGNQKIGKEPDQMINVFISQPMSGKTNEEIRRKRRELTDRAAEYFGEPVCIINSFFDANNPITFLMESMNDLGYLGMSLILLSKADAAVFAEGWENSKGCRIERRCCEEYSIDVVDL